VIARPSGHGRYVSLREAMCASNNNREGAPAYDQTFSIGSGVQTITPLTELPEIIAAGDDHGAKPTGLRGHAR